MEVRVNVVEHNFEGKPRKYHPAKFGLAVSEKI
jgi:hypothetical protein